MTNSALERQPIGKEFADSVEQGVQDLATGAVNWYHEASAEQEGYLDDALRLTAGGIKNIGNWWAESTRDQEGIGDDILRGVGSVVGTGLRVLDAGSYYGGKLGGSFATMLGVDARIGGAIGNVAGDFLAGGIVAKAGKTAKITKQLRKLRGAGATDWQLDAITKGQYAMAFGDDIPTPGVLDDVKTAFTARKGAGKTLSKLEILTKQDENYAAVQNLLEAKFRKGKPYPGETRSMMSDLLDAAEVKKTYKATNAPIAELGEKTRAGTPLKKGFQLTDWHHVFGLADSGTPIMRHPSTLKALQEGKEIPILSRAKEQYNLIVGNRSENIASVIGLRERAFRDTLVSDIDTLLGGRMDKRTINSLLGRSGLSDKPLTSAKDWAEMLFDLPTDTKSFPEIQYFNNLKGKSYRPKTVKEFTNKWAKALDDHGITDISVDRIIKMKKDPGLSIRGNDHDHIHNILRQMQANPILGKKNALYRLEQAMKDGSWYKMNTKQAAKLYAEAQANQVRVASNVMINRYKLLENMWAEAYPALGRFEDLMPGEKQVFFKKWISEIATAGGLYGDIPVEEALKPLTKRWTSGMTDVFGYTPNLR